MHSFSKLMPSVEYAKLGFLCCEWNIYVLNKSTPHPSTCCEICTIVFLLVIKSSHTLYIYYINVIETISSSLHTLPNPPNLIERTRWMRTWKKWMGDFIVMYFRWRTNLISAGCKRWQICACNVYSIFTKENKFKTLVWFWFSYFWKVKSMFNLSLKEQKSCLS